MLSQTVSTGRGGGGGVGESLEGEEEDRQRRVWMSSVCSNRFLHFEETCRSRWAAGRRHWEYQGNVLIFLFLKAHLCLCVCVCVCTPSAGGVHRQSQERASCVFFSQLDCQKEIRAMIFKWLHENTGDFYIARHLFSGRSNYDNIFSAISSVITRKTPCTLKMTPSWSRHALITAVKQTCVSVAVSHSPSPRVFWWGECMADRLKHPYFTVCYSN